MKAAAFNGTEQHWYDDFAQNACLFFGTMALGFVSYMYYERPLMKLSRNSKPTTTLAVGFCSLLLTAGIVHVVTKDLPPMMTFEENDMMTVGDFEENEMNAHANIHRPPPVDNRYTPLFFLNENSADTGWTQVVNKIIFEEHTSPKRKNIKSMANFMDMMEIYPYSKQAGASTSIVVACKGSLNGVSPCQYPSQWLPGSYWVWLDSPEICGDYYDEENASHDWYRCDKVLTIKELDMNLEKHGLMKDAGHEIVLLEMMYALNDTVNGALNQEAVYIANERYDELIRPNERESACDEVRITMLGESIAQKIAGYWKDYTKKEMLEAHIPKTALCPKVTNLGVKSHSAIVYFVCLPLAALDGYREFCADHASMVSRSVLSSFRDTRPDAVVFHDEHWSLHDENQDSGAVALPTLFDKILAFNLMASEAVKNGVDSIYYLTMSPGFSNDASRYDKYMRELNPVRLMADTLACEGGDGNRRGIPVVVIDWAKLACPVIAQKNGPDCNQKVHGFDKILPDWLHPQGPSGAWLTGQILAFVMADMAVLKSDGISNHNQAMGIPVTKNLLQLAPPDGSPPMQDLISHFMICPTSNVNKVKSSVKNAANQGQQFVSYHA